MRLGQQDNRSDQCTSDGCRGTPLGRDGRCVAHTLDEQRRQEAFANLTDGGPLDFTAGVTIDRKLLKEILLSAPQDGLGNILLPRANFSQATFDPKVEFPWVVFHGRADFRSAIFQGPADFRGVRFADGKADFRSAIFQGPADFRGVRFADDATFAWTRFQGEVNFSNAWFSGKADFRLARFASDPEDNAGKPLKAEVLEGPARFEETKFLNDANFQGVQWAQYASFERAYFLGNAWFLGGRIRDGQIRFDEARFWGIVRGKQALSLGASSEPPKIKIVDDSQLLPDEPSWLGSERSSSPKFELKEYQIGEFRDEADALVREAPDESIASVVLKRAEEVAAGRWGRRAGAAVHASTLRALKRTADRRRSEPVTERDRSERASGSTTAPPPARTRRWSLGVALGLREATTAQESPAAPQAFEPEAVHHEFSGSTDEMRTSTRWIAGAFAGVGTLLVSGIGLADVSLGRLGLVWFWAALASVLLALLGVGWVVYLASRVLTSPFTTITDLTTAPKEAAFWSDIAPRFGARAPLADPESAKALLQAREDVRSQLASGILPDEQQKTYENFDRHLQEVTHVAIVYHNHQATRRNYKRFRRRSTLAAIGVLAGVFWFVYASSQDRTAVTSPTAMDVILTDAGRARWQRDLGNACVTGPIPALAVAGSTREPQVVTFASDTCRGQPFGLQLVREHGFAVARAGPEPTSMVSPPSMVVRLRPATSPDGAETTFTYGRPGDTVLVGDWDGNGTDTLGVYRKGTFYLRNSNSTGGADLVFRFGRVGDIPIVGDWDGKNGDSIGVRRGTTFYLRNQNSTGHIDVRPFRFGRVGDIPIVGDWDGKNGDSIGVRRGTTFYLRNQRSTGHADIRPFKFGAAAHKPLIGDWDGDGRDSVGVRRGSIFSLRKELRAGQADWRFQFGEPVDIPLAGDWDGQDGHSVGVASR